MQRCALFTLFEASLYFTCSICICLSFICQLAAPAPYLVPVPVPIRVCAAASASFSVCLLLWVSFALSLIAFLVVVVVAQLFVILCISLRSRFYTVFLATPSSPYSCFASSPCGCGNNKNFFCLCVSRPRGADLELAPRRSAPLAVPCPAPSPCSALPCLHLLASSNCSTAPLVVPWAHMLPLLLLQHWLKLCFVVVVVRALHSDCTVAKLICFQAHHKHEKSI